MTISYQSWYQGQTFPYWDIPLATDTGNEDLTNVSASNFTMIFRTSGGVDTTGTGTFSIKVTNPGEIIYHPSVADVSAPFTGSIIIKCAFPPSNSTADEVVYDPINFIITAV